MKSKGLTSSSHFVLFITSYSPLFILLVIRQMKQNSAFLNFAGFEKETVWLAIIKFGFSYFLLFVLIIGFIGLAFLLNNLKGNLHNGNKVHIKKVENKNSESIAYISSYLVPFIFQDTNDWFSIVSIGIIFILIYSIYIKSNMVVINPILSPWYSLYQISYDFKGETEDCFLLSPSNDIETGKQIKITHLQKNKICYGY